MKTLFFHHLFQSYGTYCELFFNRLIRFYSSQSRKVIQKQHLPFFDQRINLLELAVGMSPSSAVALGRGLATLDVLSDQDRVLELGFGDGFLVSKFYSRACTAVDALENDPRAVAWASSRYSSGNVRFLKSDFIKDAFPQSYYDVVIWNAVYGSFDNSAIEAIIKKIADSIGNSGVFIGSISVGENSGVGSHFATPEAIETLFHRHFRVVSTRSMFYPVGGRTRHELLWRSAQSTVRLDNPGWKFSKP